MYFGRMDEQRLKRQFLPTHNTRSPPYVYKVSYVFRQVLCYLNLCVYILLSYIYVM
jgi:hypothetical protein